MQVFKSVAVCEQDSIYNTVKLCEFLIRRGKSEDHFQLIKIMSKNSFKLFIACIS